MHNELVSKLNNYSNLAFAEELLENASPKWLMGWRDICRATDERTVISAVIPLAGVGNQMPLVIFPENVFPG
mgnify:CR=1 FL=1